MTCVVGMLTDKGGVVIGADSASTQPSDYSGQTSKIRKVFHNSEFLIGGTVSWRLLQLARFAFSPPPIPDGVDIESYMVVEFVDAMRACFKEKCAIKVENNLEEGGNFLVGVRGRLFHLDRDWQVGENSWGFDACGCGANFAIGVLHARGETKEPRATVFRALTIAGECSAGVGPPYIIEDLKEGAA